MDDDSSISSIDNGEGSEDIMEHFMASFFISADPPTVLRSGDSSATDYLDEDGDQTRWHPRSSNRYAYAFGNYFKSNYYNQFLCPEKHERTHAESQRRDSELGAILGCLLLQ